MVHSLYAFAETVTKEMEAGKLDSALRRIFHRVDQIITEPLATTHVIGSKRLDDLCQQIGAIALAQNTTPRGRSNVDSFAYIVTKLQKSGGHTRVIESLIAAHPAATHTVLCTELMGQSDREFMRERLKSNPNVQLHFADAASHAETLAWLQSELLARAPKKAYLFNNHQDSVAVAALQPSMGIEGYFYHHGDHHLCLGAYLTFLKHIDLHPMGYHLCRKEMGIDNRYSPLVAPDHGARDVNLPFRPNGMLTTCTAARSNKIEPDYFISYLDVIPQLLAATTGKHIHIGKLTPWALRRIRRGLKKYAVDPSRFEYLPFVPSVWKALQEHNVDLYIASFPYGGGLTLIECMGAGVPAALHDNIVSHMMRCGELASKDTYVWRFPHDLIAFCQNVTAAQLRNLSQQAREFYLDHHHPDRLVAAIAKDFKVQPVADQSRSFRVQQDEWANLIEQQVSLTHLIKRGLYRTLRRLRARIGK